MAQRKSLRTVVQGESAKADADAATAVARKLAAPQDAQEPEAEGADTRTETVSYSIPADLVDLVRDVADARLRVARRKKREALREGRRPPSARISASAIVRDALDAQRATLEAELRELGG